MIEIKEFHLYKSVIALIQNSWFICVIGFMITIMGLFRKRAKKLLYLKLHKGKELTNEIGTAGKYDQESKLDAIEKQIEELGSKLKVKYYEEFCAVSHFAHKEKNVSHATTPDSNEATFLVHNQLLTSAEVMLSKLWNKAVSEITLQKDLDNDRNLH